MEFSDLYEQMRYAHERTDRESKAKANQAVEEGSKAVLSKHVDKRIETTGIGSLSRFEEVFGYLWGHGFKKEDLTEEEIVMRSLWDSARNNILNHMNTQRRLFKSEVEGYTITLNRFKKTIPVKPLPNNTIFND